MTTKRPDLDGQRLQAAGHSDCWLMFGGERHRICGSETHSRLFNDTKKVRPIDDLLSIQPGAPITSNSWLVQVDNAGGIFLVSGFPAVYTAKHYIISWETFLDFDFRQAGVAPIPKIVVDGLRSGIEIQSNDDRIRSKQRFVETQIKN